MERTEIHTTYVSGIERGRRNVSIDILYRIASAFESEIRDVFSTDSARFASLSWVSNEAAEPTPQPDGFPRAFWELHDKQQGAGGPVEYAEWRSAAMVHWALLINEGELRRMVDFADEVGQRIALSLTSSLANGPVEDNDYWGFLFTRLANHAAMNNALIDHVRNLLKGYEGTAFGDEARARSRALGEAPPVSFVKDFRNYLLHNAMAPMSIRLNMHEGPGLEVEALLDVSVLQQWRKWSAASKRYLDGVEALSIIRALDDCRSLREEFYDWLWEQFAGPPPDDPRWSRADTRSAD